METGVIPTRRRTEAAQMTLGTAEENDILSWGTVSRNCHFAASWAGMNEHAKAQVWQELRTLSPLAEGTMPEALLLELWAALAHQHE